MKADCTFSLEELPCLADHQLDGTPFVPMAMIVDELARRFSLNCCCFTDIEVKTPVMLRRRLAKTLVCTCDEQTSSLQDENGNLHAILTKGANIVADGGFVLAAPRDAIPSVLLKQQLYPALLFHGPTFQADFVFYEFNRQTVVVELSDFDHDNPSLGRYAQNQSVPIVLFDLLLQAAGLHLMAFSDTYGLPTACASLSIFNRQPVGNVLVRVTCHESDLYSIIAGDATGKPVMTCSGLRFARSVRKIEADKKDILKELTR
ncbi:MAG: hypothetical protein GX569_06330 [Candidatus Riflebacteria bacterium]|nr:hypothetical protein [Candidatus Riflebacteria bacterium]